MRKYKIGDTVKLNTYLDGIVEDYDTRYIYVKDTNGFVHNILKDDTTSINKLRQMFNQIDENTFDELIKLDPTYRDCMNVAGKYGEWILRLYKNNSLKNEDFYKVTEYLKQMGMNIQRLKSLGVSTDINTYKTLPDLSRALEVLETKSESRKNRETRANVRNTDLGKDAELYMETENFLIYVPLTYEASVKLGQGTSWCTATNSSRRYYDMYTDDGNKLYVMINKNNSSEKYQWNTKERYTCDKHDEEIEELELCVKYADLIEFFSKFGYSGMEEKVNSIKEIQSKPYVYDGKRIDNDLRPYIKEVKVADSVTKLGDYCFRECTSLKSITIPNGVTKLGDYCFRECTSLKSITIPSSVTELGVWCFYDCENLKSITIPNSVTELGADCFHGCESLTSITIPSSVTKLGDYCFYDCARLKSITIPNSVTKLGADCFDGCHYLKVKTSNPYVIKYCKNNDRHYEEI